MTPTPLKNLLEERLAVVETRLQNACLRAGRRRDQVTLVAVTKTVSSEVAALLPELGVFDLGENRPQELWRKAATLPKEVRWHLIGHLQRNKIEMTLPLVHRIHSVDSLRLLDALESAAAKQQRTLPILLEINASGEASKQGLASAEMSVLLPRLKELRNVQVTGLMTMAAFVENPEDCRSTFATLRWLRDRLRQETSSITDLSMGMSNDFEIAIEEGATLVRLGSVLFEGIDA